LPANAQETQCGHLFF